MKNITSSHATEELADFIKRVKQGTLYRYLSRLDRQVKPRSFSGHLSPSHPIPTEAYFPIELNFEVYEDYTGVLIFTPHSTKGFTRRLRAFFKTAALSPSKDLKPILREHEGNRSRIAMLEFFQQFGAFLGD